MSERTLNRSTRDTIINKKGRKRALRYLRVSTPSQVNTDFNPEGISIPAQREATDRKAAELNADIVDEYVEPGRTATSIEKRPVFQRMLARIKERQDVDYIIVYHFNRIFRNSIDAAITKRELAKYGVRVVSTVIDLGESPESSMIETILHAVDQYQSEASGADIRYKMGEKAKHGGTLGRAPIGYVNVMLDIDGRKVRSVELDVEGETSRAKLVAHGFELFATGQYSGPKLLQALTDAGLRTRGTKGRLPGPLTLSKLYEMLQNRYYLGVIEYQGQEYPGRHEPLVALEVFDRVQKVLALRGGGTRDRTHNHYLKGVLWCGRCKQRLIIMPGKGNGGRYFYYLCRGRQDHGCDLPYIRVEVLERIVVEHYATIRLSDEFSGSVRGKLADTMHSEGQNLADLQKRLKRQLKALDAKEDQYLDLVGAPGWPQEKLRRKLDAIALERASIQDQLTDTTGRLDTGHAFLTAALQLLSDPQAFYDRAGTSLRQAMNKVIFRKLYVDADRVVHHELTAVAEDLTEGETAARTYQRSGMPSWVVEALNGNNPLPEEGVALEDDSLTRADLLAVTLAGHGSSRAALVELRGIEPLTPALQRRCSTN